MNRCDCCKARFAYTLNWGLCRPCSIKTIARKASSPRYGTHWELRVEAPAGSVLVARLRHAHNAEGLWQAWHADIDFQRCLQAALFRLPRHSELPVALAALKPLLADNWFGFEPD